MPSALPFDTLDYARKLESAGVPVAQAEVQARALGEALLGTVATRADLDELRQSSRADLAALESRLEVRFAKIDARFEQVDDRFGSLESRLTAKIETLKLDLYGKIDTLRWMLGVVVALNAAVFVQTFLRH
jgi:hypothetical protein